MSKIAEFIKKHWQILAIIAVAGLFFAGTAWYNLYVHEYNNPAKGEPDFVKWASPDETANYIFTKLYGQTDRLAVQEDYNLWVKDIMHPRSFRSDHGAMKPVSFLGLPLIYGQIVDLVGNYRIIPFLTPFFAALGIVVFYLAIKEWLGRNVGFISAVLLAGFPVYIYYTARSMFHNVLFVVLLIFGLYFAILALKNRRHIQGFLTRHLGRQNYIGWMMAALAGIFFGLTLAVRASEALWLAPLLLLLWLFNLRKAGIIRPVLIICFVFLALLPVFYWNQILYGNFYFGGYAEMNSSLVELGQTGGELVSTAVQGPGSRIADLFSRIKENIFYFGFHPRQSLEMFSAYFVQMFWWLFWPGAAGLALYYAGFRKTSKQDWLYLAGLVLITGILVLYYGSWNFHDNPDQSSVTIGNSYTRYWLPIYLGVMPFAAYFLFKAGQGLYLAVRKAGEWAGDKTSLSPKTVTGLVITLGLAGYLSFSLLFVLYGSAEGLVYSARRQVEAKEQWQDVLAHTAGNGVVITRYHDKLLFPQRKVIVGLFNDKRMIKQYAKAVRKLPVYYYNFTLPAKDIRYLNERRLKEAGLHLDKIKPITDDFTLYRLKNSADKSKK